MSTVQSGEAAALRCSDALSDSTRRSFVLSIERWA
jgi:hypothetical protein